MTLGILIAAAASLALNSSYVLQHDGLTRAPALRIMQPLASLRSLLRQRAWLTGALLGWAGLGLELLAMTLAPLWLVQCVLAVGLVVVLLLWRRARGGTPARALLPAALLLGGGLLMIALTGGAGRAGLAAGAPALIAVAAIAAVAAILALRSPGLDPAARQGVAAGVLYGATTLGLAAVVTAFSAGSSFSTASLAGGLVAVVTAVAGFCCFQRGLQRGEPIAVVTTMTAGMNAFAIAGALALTGLGLAGVALLLEVAGLLAVCLAGVLAARALSARTA